MTDDAPTPGERRLAHPPSDRYRAAEAAAAARATAAAGPPRPTSVVRGAAYAGVVALLGALAITVLGGVVTLTVGLVILAAAIGWGSAQALRIGAGSTLDRPRRIRWAVAVALVGVALGQVGLWVYAGTEGGVLPLLDYLDQAFGLVVPVQLVVAPVSAWFGAR